MTDDAVEDPGFFVGKACDMCGELIGPGDDALGLPHLNGHLECHLRAGMGDVQHLEGRCSCFGTEIPDFPARELTGREDAAATLVWLLEHRQGRFRRPG